MKLHQFNDKRCRGKARRFQPQVEHLEDRVCLSCRITPAGEALTITDAFRMTNNAITIKDDGTSVVVLCDSDPVPPPFAGITEIRVATGKGNDTVIYNLLQSPTAARTVDVALGAGVDTFTMIHDETQLDVKSNLEISVRGGRGADHLDVRLNLGLSAHFGLSVYGEQHKDLISARLSMRALPAPDPRFDVLVSGDDANDTLRLTLFNDARIPGVARLRGGGGSNNCTAGEMRPSGDDTIVVGAEDIIVDCAAAT